MSLIRHWTFQLAILGLALLVGGLATVDAEDDVAHGSDGIPAQCPPLCVGPAPEPGSVAGSVIPAFEWEMVPRYDASWDAWFDPNAALEALINPPQEDGYYDRAFVHPESWAVILDACTSTADADTIVAYDWDVAGGGLLQSFTTPACRLEAGLAASPIRFPVEGAYTVTLTVTTAGERAESTTKVVQINDILVVSIGDSAASGEGNPPWVDRACHRSRTSGHAFAAAALEAADLHSSITFLSFACSGATVSSIVSQLDAVADHLCPGASPCNPEQRRGIDLLLITGGVNDLSFTAVVESCALGRSDCDRLQANYDRISLGMTRLTSPTRGYGGIQGQIEALGLRVGETYLTEYPANPFTDQDGPEGCGLLFGINDREAAWMNERGDQLNQLIQNEAIRWGWFLVPGMTERFAGHGYCVSPAFDFNNITSMDINDLISVDLNDDTGFPYYVGLFDSFVSQGNKDGTLHPNRLGHRAIAELIGEAFAAPKPDRTPRWRAHVTVEQIRVFDTGVSGLPSEGGAPAPVDDIGSPTFIGDDQVVTEDEVAVKLDVRIAPLESGVLKPGASVNWESRLPQGEWVALPADLFSFSINLAPVDLLHLSFATPLPLLPQGTLDMPLPPIRRTVFATQAFPAPGFGMGPWTARSTEEMGYFELTYRIRVEAIGLVDADQVLAPIAPPMEIQTPLASGWNLVGWTGPPTPVTEALPSSPGLAALEWDAEQQQFRSYRADLPASLSSFTDTRFASGLWLYTPEPTTWTQPALDFGHTIVLEPGFNLVVWTGPDGTAVEKALADVAAIQLVASWDADQGRFWTYGRDLPSALNTLTRLQHGEALWVLSETATTWQHPDARPLSIIDISAGEFVGGDTVLAP